MVTHFLQKHDMDLVCRVRQLVEEMLVKLNDAGAAEGKRGDRTPRSSRVAVTLMVIPVTGLAAVPSEQVHSASRRAPRGRA